MAAGHDMEDVLLVGDIRDRLRQRRVDVAENEVHMVAVDQLARLLHRGAGVAAGRILDQQLDLAAEDAALGIDLFERELGADHLILAERRVGARERIVEPDLNCIGGARRDDEGRRNLRNARQGSRLDQRAAVEVKQTFGLIHFYPPLMASR